MRYYRNLSPFKLLSFDLDDTLYDNHPVIAQAETAFLDFLNKISGLQISLNEWRARKNAVEQANPQFCEDVIAWRMQTTRELLRAYHTPAAHIEPWVVQSQAHFTQWRHKINVPEASITLLNQLKTRYPLVAITNGNVEPHKIGLNQFDLVLRGGEHGRAKPHPELFALTAHQFHLHPHEILHIGDNLLTDVQGAIQAGAQCAWLNLSGADINRFREARLLPTLEIHHLEELLKLG